MKKICLALIIFFSSNPLHSEEVSSSIYPVVILGGGPAALTAALYLTQAGITPLVITGGVPGGMITLSHQIENWPSLDRVDGITLADRLMAQAEKNGAILLAEKVVNMDLSQSIFTLTTCSLFHPLLTQKIQTYACIIATGAYPRFLNVSGEQEYFLKGVHTCAVCDGALYKDKVVAVVGGGDASMQEAGYLSSLAKKVYILVRGNQFKGKEEKYRQEVLKNPRVEVCYNTRVERILGKDGHLSELILFNTTSQKKISLEVSALFLAIGSIPNTELFRGQLEMDAQQYLILKEHQQTSKPGVFAAGDVSDPEFRQAITAAGDGAKAALQAQKYLVAVGAQNKGQSMLLKKNLANVEIPSISTLEQLNALLNEKKKPFVFIDFYGSFCAPCRSFALLYQSWAQKYASEAVFLKAEVQSASSLFQTYSIQSIPTLIIWDTEKKEYLSVSSEGIGLLAEFLSGQDSLPSFQEIKKALQKKV